MSLEISAEADSTVLPPDGGKPTVEVSFSSVGKKKIRNRQVVLCIDTSASMGNDDEDGVRKLERAKRGAKRVLDELEPEDQLAVVGFDSDPKVATPLKRWRKSAEEEVLRAIETLESSNGTDVYKGVEASWEQFQEIEEGRSVARRIVLLSDGQDFRDASTYRSLGQDVTEDGISIVAAGIGGEYDADVIIALAEGSNGTPTHLTSAADMESFFRQEVAEAGKVVAANPELVIDTGEGFRLEEAYITPPNPRQTDVSAGDETATIGLPDLTDDTSISVTTRFLAPPRSPGIEYTLADFELKTDELVDNTVVNIEYREKRAKSKISEGIRVAHADAKVSAGIRDTTRSKADVKKTIEEITEANEGWEGVVDDLEKKLQEAEREEGGMITSGLTKVDR